MVCTANDLQEWKDFPKELRVLLLDGDSSAAAEMRLKLEAMVYIVSTFCKENEALTAILDKPGSFHVAIVEAMWSLVLCPTWYDKRRAMVKMRFFLLARLCFFDPFESL